MYFQKDYVLRMIEMTGELIRRICSIAREADAREELNEISQRACGMPMSLLRTGDPDDLVQTLLEPQRLLAAELLLIELEVDRRTNADEALLPIQLQALSLFASLREPDYMLPAGDHAARLLNGLLGQLPVESLQSTAALLERCGLYAACEDALYAAYESSASLKPQLLGFYQRLTKLGDDALIAGGLTRGEIDEGLAALN